MACTFTQLRLLLLFPCLPPPTTHLPTTYHSTMEQVTAYLAELQKAFAATYTQQAAAAYSALQASNSPAAKPVLEFLGQYRLHHRDRCMLTTGGHCSERACAGILCLHPPCPRPELDDHCAYTRLKHCSSSDVATDSTSPLPRPSS